VGEADKKVSKVACEALQKGWEADQDKLAELQAMIESMTENQLSHEEGSQRHQARIADLEKTIQEMTDNRDGENVKQRELQLLLDQRNDELEVS
jgi:hypothetical protein